MEDSTPIQKPQFLVTARDEATKLQLEQLGRDIMEHPELYAPIIFSIGAMAVTQSEGTRYEIDGDRAGRVEKYFKDGMDLDVDYDTPTEQSLMSDETYKTMVAARKKVSRKDEPAAAFELEKKMQRYRLAFFIKRLIDFNESNQHLRSAG